MKLSDIKFRLKSSGASSERYGPCEICGEHAAEVFTQVGFRYFLEDRLNATPPIVAGVSATHYRSPGYSFGHESCLVGARASLCERFDACS